MPDYLQTPDYTGAGVGILPDPSAMGTAVRNALDLAQRYATNKVQQVATMPQRAIESAANYQQTGSYDPGPILEAATAPLGVGTLARLPIPTTTGVARYLASRPLKRFEQDVAPGFGSLIPLDQRT